MSNENNYCCKICLFKINGETPDVYYCNSYKLQGGCLEMFYFYPGKRKRVNIIPLSNSNIYSIEVEINFLKGNNKNALEDK